MVLFPIASCTTAHLTSLKVMIAAAAGDNVRILAVDTSEEACKKVRAQWQCITPMFQAKRSTTVYAALVRYFFYLWPACKCNVQIHTVCAGNKFDFPCCPDQAIELGAWHAPWRMANRNRGSETLWMPCCMTGLLLLTLTGR